MARTHSVRLPSHLIPLHPSNLPPSPPPSPHNSTAFAWCIYELACNPAVQSKLRAELLQFSSSASSSDSEFSDAEDAQPSIDALNALPYLDGVLRESMRLRPAIPYTMRVAQKDDVVPLAKPYTDRDGKVCDAMQ